MHTRIHPYIHTYITLHNITLHYITLHYITLHTYIHTKTQAWRSIFSALQDPIYQLNQLRVHLIKTIISPTQRKTPQ